MKISELLIPEIHNETRITAAFLKRLPQDKLDWKPHDKSMPMGMLAAHILEIYGWIVATMETDGIDMANYRPPEVASVEDMVGQLEPNAQAAIKALDKDDSSYWQDWSMTHGDHVIMKMPRYTTLRSMVLSQFPHHRAQLGLYFRLLDIPVPASYGPSADEN
ncbi:MAG: DinB family protein [Deinococcales bacterium]